MNSVEPMIFRRAARFAGLFDASRASQVAPRRSQQVVAAYNRPVIQNSNAFWPDGQLAAKRCPISVQDRSRSSWRARLPAIADNSQLLAEAGTGTGKTFAYLVPALLSGAKVIIATGTKTLLQDPVV